MTLHKSPTVQTFLPSGLPKHGEPQVQIHQRTFLRRFFTTNPWTWSTKNDTRSIFWQILIDIAWFLLCCFVVDRLREPPERLRRRLVAKQEVRWSTHWKTVQLYHQFPWCLPEHECLSYGKDMIFMTWNIHWSIFFNFWGALFEPSEPFGNWEFWFGWSFQALPKLSIWKWICFFLLLRDEYHW